MKTDLTNQTFGRLTAREMVGKKGSQNLWRCECECGGEKLVPTSYLRNGHTTSCGCIVRGIRENAIKKGDRWGRLEAVEFVEYAQMPSGKRRAVWKFKCDCGNEKIMLVNHVKFGNVRSCGCMAMEQVTNLRKDDITEQIFGRLKAIRPTDQRTEMGAIIWELQCQCGNVVYKTVNEMKTGRVLSCGCLYTETRKDCASYRKDLVGSTCLSSIVATKTPSVMNTSGHTGVYFDKRSQKWQAYINYKKKRYYLGAFKDINDAIRARKEGEARNHDPVIMKYFANLTPERKKDFIEYLKSIGAAVEISGITDEKKE